ncbi:Down syndrome critical region protein 3 homolog [Cephus cinctus]|uniref:Vacuolar protein sorting-associated protein 26C n=1 Tax=Cephus cinctus TaxID=211228 RepID=A0AAJ7CDN6_CEPCN|nr:Down syndrome critical region protein 3 homolog [Cephus cinctus]XP_015607611.1 Down syndrome critical region protein 3 homolog [Cephus cinctus]XP_015607612.1 Down syndrome critical region protein 3 homolog [Cephus cinctus]XP_015607613.1 Down syndrome critical region protein 3 homolog [Cephus cinctus]XP_015607614.1 Down syndrome critical region protein 3 homolog [Cephus cinctus]XP_015607615.1 Down syndrome critical region protein 3 homolog [Cephus cinctus]XP_015607616.1 Down syndrome critic
MSINVDIRLKRASKIYHEGEIVAGLIILQTNSDIKHDGIFLTMEGSVNLQLSSKNVGIFEAFYNSVKPIQLVQYTLDVAPLGKIPSGRIEIPFELPLKPRGSKSLYQTYHGVFVNVQYLIRCDIKRSFLAKDVSKSLEFIVEDKPNPKVEKEQNKIVLFKIMPESLQNARDRANLPSFLISGRLDSLYCNLSEPLTGEVIIEKCEATIKSIELQLVRVETCGCAEGYSRDATEIQNIQIGEGNVCTGIGIPIYMIFPRLFTCPTLSTSNFKVEFEVNLIIVFADDYLVTENFPIVLNRH